MTNCTITDVKKKILMFFCYGCFQGKWINIFLAFKNVSRIACVMQLGKIYSPQELTTKSPNNYDQ